MSKIKQIKIDEAELNEMNRYLSSDSAIDNFGPDEIIKTYTAEFDHQIRVDLDVQNTEDGPYVNAMLFDNGQEAGVIDPIYELDGKYSFEYNGENYIVEVLSR